jgi:thioesterase domain-containing protein
MTPQPASVTIESLRLIWERVLQRAPIGAQDNFFDLGGDGLAAASLFSEIKELSGRQLPSVLIYNSPTITALAAELERPSLSRCPPVFLLRPGSAAPPIFIAPGLGGSILDFFRLIQHIETDRPIYGMQGPGFDGLDDPIPTVEGIAQYHLDAIKALQPHGPYVLIGYSLGGIVALEIAQRLIAAGEAIALLAMLDSYPHRTYLRLLPRSMLLGRLTLNRIYRATGVSVPRRDQFSSGRSITPAVSRNAEFARTALRRYQPSFYRGKIRFVRAEIGTHFPANPGLVWSHLAKGFEVESIPCDHFGMIDTHFDHLAQIVSRYLKEIVLE